MYEWSARNKSAFPSNNNGLRPLMYGPTNKLNQYSYIPSPTQGGSIETNLSLVIRVRKWPEG